MWDQTTDFLYEEYTHSYATLKKISVPALLTFSIAPLTGENNRQKDFVTSEMEQVSRAFRIALQFYQQAKESQNPGLWSVASFNGMNNTGFRRLDAQSFSL